MLVFEIVIALLIAGAGLTALSHRIGAPYPAMVALAGAALALIPGTPPKHPPLMGFMRSGSSRRLAV